MSKRRNKNYILGLSNVDLIDHVISAAGGDDWDGCFTVDGYKEYLFCKKELNRRLKKAGFIDNNIEDCTDE